MKNQGFLIQLDNQIRSFFSGQTISGRVLVQQDKPRDFNNISITFEGSARVHWTETRNHYVGTGKDRRNVKRTVHFTARNNYFTCKIFLLGNENGNFTLPPGGTSYPFSFTLPLNLPSSFTSRTGIVHYLMEARMKRSWMKADVTAIVPFTVNGILDLNLEPGVSQSVCYEKQKNVGCLCCQSGPVGYKIVLQRTGFVPGEYAQFNGEFINHSRRKVKGMSVTLMQVAKFHAQGHTRTESKVICSAQSPPIEPGESDYWGGNILKIPPVPPTRLANCQIIDVQYVLKFEMDLSGLTMNLKAEFPITIGTIPFRNMFVDFMPSMPQPPQPAFNPFPMPPENLPGYSGNLIKNAPEIEAIPSAPVFDMYPDLPPPSYAEAMQSERFEQNPDESDNGKENLGFGQEGDQQEGQQNAAPSAPPPTYDYVPNYITYGYNQKPN